jgi:Helix-turn-helix domain./Probable transposase.
MLKTYKYRLYPTRKQTEKLEWTLETCRILYNSCLADRNRHYEETKKSLSRIDQQKILVQDKKNIEYLTNIHSQVLQDVLFRVEKAYKNFFRRLKDKSGKAGYPRFKNQVCRIYKNIL